MVAKHLTESYTEWFAPHGEEWWQRDKDFKEGRTKAPIIYARSTGNDTNQAELPRRKKKESITGKRRKVQ
jgi:hypothetical protein